MRQSNHYMALVTGLALAFAATFWAPGDAGSAVADDTSPVTDASIATAVEDRLFYDAGVSPQGIVVSAMNGVVTLEGEAESIGEKQRAALLAETVRGVESVINRLEVVPDLQMSGAELAAAVELALVGDPATDGYEVGVAATEDGTVTLTGIVDGFREQDLVLDVASGVEGVRRIVNDVDVLVDASRSDAEIAAEVEETLAWDRYVQAGLMNVQVEDGIVSLTGTVPSAAEKQRAAKLAYVSGVARVDASGLTVEAWADDPEIRDQPAPGFDDADLRKAVERALAQDPRVAAFEIDVIVRNGTAILEGEVDNLQARRSAVRDARDTVGVERVRDQIHVVADTPADADLENAVVRALEREPLVERGEVIVEARDGIVTLAGMVDTWFEKAQADYAAGRVSGVLAVVNELAVVNAGEHVIAEPYADEWEVYAYDWYERVRVYPSASDAVIKQRIESQFFWSPFVDGEDIDVNVDGGVVILEGSVGSPEEREAATENALQGGAAWVDNDLVINPG